MLVLSRKQDSAVHIGSDIQVKVLSIKRAAANDPASGRLDIIRRGR